MEKARVRDAIMLLLLSYIKARAVLKDTDNNRYLFNQLETQWSSILSAVSDKLDSEV